MQELERILKDHAARYPQMEAVDYLKLVYQNEFGGGHLVPEGEQTEQREVRPRRRRSGGLFARRFTLFLIYL